jgi:hypothetical protein
MVESLYRLAKGGHEWKINFCLSRFLEQAALVDSPDNRTRWASLPAGSSQATRLDKGVTS